MAFMTEAQAAALANGMAQFNSGVEFFFRGYVNDRVNEIAALNDVADETPEQRNVTIDIDAVVVSAQDMKSQILTAITSSYGHLGRLAGTSDPTDTDQSLADFNSFIKDNSKAFTSRSFVRTPAVGGSNVGDAKIAIYTFDLNGSPIDVGHIDTLTIKCDEAADQGRTQGREQYLVTGQSQLRTWEEGRTAIGLSYTNEYGLTPIDFSDQQIKIITGGELLSFSGSSQSGNKVRNGDFKAFGGLVPDNWTVLSGGGNIAANNNTPINGINSLVATGDFVLESVYQAKRLINGQAYAQGVKLRADGALTGTLLIQIMSKDESEVYGELSVDLSTLADGINTTIQPVIFLMPTTAKASKLKLTLSSLTGTSLTVDDVATGDTVLIDGLFTAIYSGDNLDATGDPQGVTKRGDVFTVVTTGDDSLLEKYYINEPSGRYVLTSGIGVSPWA